MEREREAEREERMRQYAETTKASKAAVRETERRAIETPKKEVESQIFASREERRKLQQEIDHIEYQLKIVRRKKSGEKLTGLEQAEYMSDGRETMGGVGYTDDDKYLEALSAKKEEKENQLLEAKQHDRSRMAHTFAKPLRPHGLQSPNPSPTATPTPSPPSSPRAHSTPKKSIARIVAATPHQIKKYDDTPLFTAPPPPLIEREDSYVVRPPSPQSYSDASVITLPTPLYGEYSEYSESKVEDTPSLHPAISLPDPKSIRYPYTVRGFYQPKPVTYFRKRRYFRTKKDPNLDWQEHWRMTTGWGSRVWGRQAEMVGEAELLGKKNRKRFITKMPVSYLPYA